MGIITGILIPETGSIQSFSDKFSYVGATPLIIKGSIRENLLPGNHSLIDDTKILNMIENTIYLMMRNSVLMTLLQINPFRLGRCKRFHL